MTSVVYVLPWRAFSYSSPFVRFAVRHKESVSVWAAIALFTSGAIPSAARAQGGIAARYPGDAGIENDPDVILADGFEAYTSPNELLGKWSEIQGALQIATGASDVYSGSKSLQLTLPISSTGTGQSVHKVFASGKTQLYIRAYFKYAADYYMRGSNHNGLGIQGNYPPGGAGTKPPTDGRGFFLSLLQNNIETQPRPGETEPGYSNIYAYWPKQRSNYGDHFYPNGTVVPPGADGNNGDWLTYPAQYQDFTVHTQD